MSHILSSRENGNIFSTSNSLVKTSYVKMIDVWYFGTLCVPFVEVILATWIEYLMKKKEKNARAERVSSRARAKTGMRKPEQKENSSLLLLALLRMLQTRLLPAAFAALAAAYFAAGAARKSSGH